MHVLVHLLLNSLEELLIKDLILEKLGFEFELGKDVLLSHDAPLLAVLLILPKSHPHELPHLLDALVVVHDRLSL